MSNRTKYTSTIQLTARERGAVYRFLRNRDIAMGDYSLTFGVLRRVLDKAVKLKDK